MKYIYLDENHRVQVDDEDYERIKDIPWNLTFQGDYPIINCIINMPRLLLLPPKHLMVDHIDRNPFNNQRENLRACTPQQNMWNKSPHKNGASKYKGVSWATQSYKWRATINKNGKQIHLGLFEDEILAAMTYNAAARELYGEFACLNTFDEYE